MKRSGKLILAVLASGLICGQLCAPHAQAVPISGNIAFAGTATLDSISAGNATAVMAWHFSGNTGTPYVAAADGDFAGALGLFATFNAPWHFGSGLSPLWSVFGFTFDLLTSTITSQGFDQNGLGYVAVSGTGFVHGNGFDPTFGTWSFTTQDPSAGGSLPRFSFSAATGTVPDSGSTVALLGLTLVGVEFLRRTLRKARE